MLNKKWLAGVTLAAFLTITAGAGIPQAQASELRPAAIQTSVHEKTELAKHHGDRPHKSQSVRGHRDRAPRHVDRHPPHREPPHRTSHHSSHTNDAIVGGIIGGIIGGILVSNG